MESKVQRNKNDMVMELVNLHVELGKEAGWVETKEIEELFLKYYHLVNNADSLVFEKIKKAKA